MSNPQTLGWVNSNTWLSRHCIKMIRVTGLFSVGTVTCLFSSFTYITLSIALNFILRTTICSRWVNCSTCLYIYPKAVQRYIPQHFSSFKLKVILILFHAIQLVKERSRCWIIIHTPKKKNLHIEPRPPPIDRVCWIDSLFLLSWPCNGLIRQW